MAYACLGYARLTGLDTVKTLANCVVNGAPGIPTKAQEVYITAETKGIRWRGDTTDPTSILGHPLAAGDSMYYSQPLAGLRFIEQSASAVLHVTFYGNP